MAGGAGDIPAFIRDVVWTPPADTVARSELTRFMTAHDIPDFQALLRRSAADPAWFWDAAVKALGIDFLEPYTKTLDDSDGIQWTRWWIDGKFNIVHNCLDRYRGTDVESKVALIWEGEPGEVRRLTYAELDRQVSRFAAGLISVGTGAGDRIGIFMPMSPEVAVAVLACAKIGAVIVPVFSGYGPEAVAQRLNDCGATVLVCADAFYRRGSLVPMKEVADRAVGLSPSVRTVVIHRRAAVDIPWTPGRDRSWDELVSTDEPFLESVPMDPEDPLLIIYTSGTTGRPKGTVHVQGGFPIKGVQDMVHGFDVRRDDTVFWFTDIGWMMGAWLIYGTLARAATMVMYEGTPDTPDPGRLWRLVANHGVTVMGLSPTLVRSLRAAGDDHLVGHELSRLRVLGSTGEMWDPESWMWLFERVGGGRIPIINYSGGTELAGGILCGNVITPLRPASFAGPLPGMDADVVDEHGQSVRGRVGELVVRSPSPGMTRGFWGDRQRYLDTYWSRFPGVWLHGDWAYVDERDGLWYVLGRSDDTLKIAGKRIGPGEVEAVLVTHPAVLAAAAVGVPDAMKGEALVCFIVVRPGTAGGAELEKEVADRVADSLGKPLRPKLVKVVADLPRTRNAKIMRKAARAAFLGVSPGDVSSIENPGALEALARLGRDELGRE
jgi:acetyl-CoA synthetase